MPKSIPSFTTKADAETRFHQNNYRWFTAKPVAKETETHQPSLPAITTELPSPDPETHYHTTHYVPVTDAKNSIGLKRR